MTTWSKAALVEENMTSADPLSPELLSIFFLFSLLKMKSSRASFETAVRGAACALEAEVRAGAGCDESVARANMPLTVVLRG